MDEEKQEKAIRIKSLEALLKKYEDSYYSGEAEISDSEFDLLYEELKSLDPKNALLRKISGESSGVKKVKKKHRGYWPPESLTDTPPRI